MTPPLVLLHAFPFDSRLFDAVRTDLAEATTVLTPDLPGFGSGPALPDGPPDLDRDADAVIADLDERGIERAIVGGVSMGGYVAFSLLRRFPDRVAGLLLVDTRAGADDDVARHRRLDVADRADRGDIAAGAEAIAPLIGADTPDDVRRRLAAIAGEVPAATIAWAQRAMAARPDSGLLLTHTDVPVLVLVGEQDTVTPPAVARHMADAAPRGELNEIPGVGHLPPAENPAEFSSLVRRWLHEVFPTG